MHRAAYAHMGIVVGVVSALVILASAFFTRDQIPRLPVPPADLEPASLRSLWTDVVVALRNRNYRMLVFGFFFLSATAGVRETLESYMSLFFWELPAERIRYFAMASPIGFGLAFAITPGLNARIGKRNSAVLGVIALVIAQVLPVSLRLLGLFPANHSPRLFPLLWTSQLIYWAGIAALMISIMSALADVADEHELTTHRRQEGIFYAARTFFGKLINAVGHLLAGVALDVIGFQSNSKPSEVPASIVRELGIVYGPIAALGAIGAIAFYAQYHIDKQRLAEIQSELARRKQVAAGGPEAVELVNPSAEVVTPQPALKRG
jgi:Na+/melibiose symporter-like transporter